jgi:hypothetical protein
MCSMQVGLLLVFSELARMVSRQAVGGPRSFLDHANSSQLFL